MPAAEVPVSAALVLRLVSEQHPDLAERSLTAVANGWDNAIFRLGDDLAVRLPRRQAAAELIRTEQRWLPELSQGLPVGTPVPVREGVPTSYFPWYWTITRWLDGAPAAFVETTGRSSAAADLARFVVAFQRPAPADAPRNPVRGVPLPTRDTAVEQRIAAAGLPTDVLDRTGRRTFMEVLNRERAYDPATWQRARGWALCMASAMAATSDDNPAFRTMGAGILDDVLSDEGPCQ